MPEGMSEGMTPRRIATWLRRYRDWRAELDAGPGAVSLRDYSRPFVSGGGLPGDGPVFGQVRRQEALTGQVRTVERWLASLSPLERVAAEFWLADTDGTITEVARQSGLDYQQARRLVHVLPLVIWGRFYFPKQKFVTNT